MKSISRATILFVLVFIIILPAHLLHGQGLPTDLVPIAAAEIPPGGHTYYSIARFSSWPPFPMNWLSGSNVQCYVSASGGAHAIFVDDREIDYAQRAAELQVLQAAERAARGESALRGEGFEGEGLYGSMMYGANDFWLEALSVSSNLFNATLHGTTNGSTYVIWSTEGLSSVATNAWLAEGSLQGGTNDATLFALGVALRTNSLFIRAEAWDECASTTLPLWWQLAYFGVTAVDAYGDYDGDGTDNLSEYLLGTDPNTIRFSIVATNLYTDGTAVPLQLSIRGGVPSYIAVLRCFQWN